MAGIPVGTTLDRRESERIASDAARVAATHSYWRARLSAVGEDVLTSGAFTSPAMRMAATTPNRALGDLVPATRHVFDAADEPVRFSGCLVSMEEISTSVGAGAALDALADALKALTAAGTGAGPAPAPADVAHGITACREVFDLVRRYRVCAANAATYRSEAATLLALYRQEGSLCMSPPTSSHAHGPLIRTAAGTCRTPEIPLGFDPSAERPGFNLAFDRSGFGTTSATPESEGFGLLFRNLLALGGLDSIVNPRLQPFDELRQLLGRARAGPVAPPIAAIDADIRAKLTPFQRPILDELCLGLLMWDLDDVPTTQLPDATALLDRLKDTAKQLVAAHPASRRGADVLLSGADDAPEVSLILNVQARWFESRTRLVTLLARRDRSGAIAFDPLSPFLTYLRYNTGDAIFAGILLRAVAAMKAARQEATLHPWPSSPAFVAALDASALTEPERRRAEKLVNDHWKPHVGAEEAWRHLGLIDALRTAGLPPMWLGGPPAPPPATFLKTADVARELFDLLVGTDVVGAVEQLLHTAPIGKVLALGIGNGIAPAGRRAPFVKAHSFDRLRQVYAKALSDAGLPA